jgi:glycosyltransferase involved in cell wall biosynthesis
MNPLKLLNLSFLKYHNRVSCSKITNDNCYAKKEKKLIVLSSNTSFTLYNFRLNLMRALKGKGYRVIAVAMEDKYSEFLRKEFEFHPIKKLDKKGTNPLKDLLFFLELFWLYRKIKPDICIHFTIKVNIYGAIAGGLLGIPTISVITGLAYPFIKETWLTRLVKLLYFLAFKFNKGIIFLNEEDMKTLASISGTKSYLIEGEGVDTEFFSPNQVSKEKENFIFLFVGRLIKDKGLLELVEAFRRLRIDYPNLELMVVGELEPEYPNSLTEDEIKNLVKDGLINYLGFQSDVRPFYSLADCVVLPSYYREGVPRVLLEAISMGKPIITTDAPGCRNVCIDGINGFLVKPKNIESLYIAMKKIVELDKEKLLMMGLNGRKLAKEKYEISKIINAYLEIIEKTINSTHSHT